MSEWVVHYSYSTSHTGCLPCNSTGYVLALVTNWESPTLVYVRCKYCNGRGHL